MKNYILADYRRILTRVPRLIFLVIYEIAIIISVINGWKDATVYTSLDFLNSLSLWFTSMGTMLLGVCTLINVFGDDFKCKTMQVAIGIGVTRLQVVISKVIQCALILITDLLVTTVVIGVMAVVTGTPLAAHQLFQLFADSAHIFAGAVCWIAVVSGIVFKLQSMLLPMAAYILLSFGVLDFLFQALSRVDNELLQRLQLNHYTPTYFANQLRTDMLMEKFDMVPAIGLLIWTAAGIALAFLIFRKEELDF